MFCLVLYTRYVLIPFGLVVTFAGVNGGVFVSFVPALGTRERMQVLRRENPGITGETNSSFLPFGDVSQPAFSKGRSAFILATGFALPFFL